MTVVERMLVAIVGGLIGGLLSSFLLRCAPRAWWWLKRRFRRKQSVQRNTTIASLDHMFKVMYPPNAFDRNAFLKQTSSEGGGGTAAAVPIPGVHPDDDPPA